MSREIVTAYDALESLMGFIGDQGTGIPQRALRQVMQSALRTVAEDIPSPFFLKRGRLFLKAPYATGTIAYDHAGGSYSRQVTLSGGIWPTWAEDASIQIGDLVCDVESRQSDTVITLDAVLNPGEDVVAGTTYSLFKRYYVLPEDFSAASDFYGEQLEVIGRSISYNELLALERRDATAGVGQFYAIGGVQDLVGAVGLFLWRPVDTDTTLDYFYRRKPREIRFTGFDASDQVGTITTNGTTTITGSSDAFSDAMVGSLLRIGDTVNAPTGLNGLYPWKDQVIIHGVEAASHILISDNIPAITGSALKYVVTDYLDVDPVAYDAFMARCRFDLAITRRQDGADRLEAAYREAKQRAKSASCHDVQPRVACPGFRVLPNLIQYGDVID